MNTFRRKALLTAVLAGLGAVAMADTHPNSGQALVYPYFTVEAPQSPYNTYIEAVNGSDRLQTAFLSLVGIEENNRARNVVARAASANSGGLSTGQGYTTAGVPYASYTFHLRI